MPEGPDTARDSAVRKKTDESLRAERSQTDSALDARQRAVDAAADDVVALAREQADAVLGAARDRADDVPDQGGPSLISAPEVAEERVAEDAVLQDERDTADESLRLAREEATRAMRALIPFERAKTDRHLLTERSLWDDAVANRDDFLGIVSHDLRGLLGGIVTAAALLSAKAEDNAEGRHAVAQAERIQRYAARMNGLIGDLVDVASIEAGKLSVAATVSDAAALLSEAADTFATTAAARNITIELLLEESPLWGTLDYARVLQVMTNIMSNAVKFTPAGGKIAIRGNRLGSGLKLSVSDTGPGIPEHLLETVFDRFWQIDSGERRGLGLGLYISRCIVDAHHGRVWAERGEISGTTICLTLPGPADAAARPTAP